MTEHTTGPARRTGQQHTGNHPKPGEPHGVDRFGGTRAGAENVEPSGTTRSPADRDMERAGGIRGGSADPDGEAGGVD